jgi:GNAT superfamily N-acetyltransferase
LTPVPLADPPYVRAARPSDLRRVAELYAAAVEELGVMRGGRVLLGLNGREAPVEQSFGRQLEDPVHLVVVALIGPDQPDHIVGYGTCRSLELSTAERVGSIDDLYVAPGARRSGAGRAIANLLVEWCSSQGCTGVDANALPGSRAVKSFFEGEGFTARLLVMHRPLT